jgi:hypothetical protein
VTIVLGAAPGADLSVGAPGLAEHRQGSS